MSDTDGYDDDDTGSPTVTLSRAQIRTLEKKARERDTFAARIEQMERQQTFVEAGIDLKDPKMGYFIKGYDGDLTADAIKKAAMDAGFIEPPQPSGEQAAVMDSAQRIASAAAGAVPLGAVTEGTMRAEMEQAAASGGRDAIMAVARKYGAVSTEDYS